MHRTGALALAAAAGLAAASSANAATVLTVGPDSLCGPAGCFAGEKKAYTRTFSGLEIGGAVTALSLFRGVVGATPNQAVRITFQLADGTEVVWGNYRLSVMQGDQFVTIDGQDFDWASSLGDVTLKLELIDLLKAGRGASDGFWGLGGGGGGGFGAPAEHGGSASAPESPFGDTVTSGPRVRPALPEPLALPEPVLGPVQAIAGAPEPGAWALMILGFGAAGAMLRRRIAYHPRYG